MEMTAEAIINRIEQSYIDIWRLCQDIPVEALIAPVLANGWSVKDTVAHLAAWDRRFAELLGVAHYSDGPLKAHPVVDALNLEIYQERRNWSWAEVALDSQESIRALLEAIRILPEERLTDQFVLAIIAEETWEHYAQHLHPLQQWRERVLRQNPIVSNS